jgi:hypothetical protein
MASFSANPFAAVFAFIAIGAVLCYGLYAAIDRFGLEVSSAVATVVGKHVTAPGTTYNTNIVANRAWVHSYETPELYAVFLNVENEPSVGLVSQQMFVSLHTNETVRVTIRRTRVTKRLEVLEVTK